MSDAIRRRDSKEAVLLDAGTSERVVALLERIATGVEALVAASADTGSGVNASGLQLLDARAFAALLGIDVRTLRVLRHEGVVPKPVMVGRSPRWRRAQIEAWIEEQQR